MFSFLKGDCLFFYLNLYLKVTIYTGLKFLNIIYYQQSSKWSLKAKLMKVRYFILLQNCLNKFTLYLY